MARDFLFAVMLGSAALTGLMVALPDVKGWKSYLITLCGVGGIFLIWNFARLHLPR